MKFSRNFLHALLMLGVLLVGTLAAPVNKTPESEEVKDKNTESGSQDFSQTEKQLEDLVSEERPEMAVKETAEVDETPQEPEKAIPPQAQFENGYQLFDAGAAPEDADLTPKAVAEYLLITGDFKGFDVALLDLTEAGVLTPQEARQYRDDVSWEYENLASQMMDAEAAYLQEINEPIESYFRNSRRQAPAPAMERRNLPQDMMDTENVDFGSELRKLQSEAAQEREATVDQLLQAIVDEYYWRNKEAPASSVELPAANDNVIEEPAIADVEMEKVIELIQEVMDGEPMPSEVQKAPPAAVAQPVSDETEAELEELPHAQAEQTVEQGSGEIEAELPKIDSQVQVEPASA